MQPVQNTFRAQNPDVKALSIVWYWYRDKKINEKNLKWHHDTYHSEDDLPDSWYLIQIKLLAYFYKRRSNDNPYNTVEHENHKILNI